MLEDVLTDAFFATYKGRPWLAHWKNCDDSGTASSEKNREIFRYVSFLKTVL